MIKKLEEELFVAFASCWWRGRSGGSGCSRGGTFALVFAYDLAFVFAFAVSRPSIVTLVASASAPVWGFSFSFTFLQIRARLEGGENRVRFAAWSSTARVLDLRWYWRRPE